MKFLQNFESVYGDDFKEVDISFERMLYLICITNDDCVYDVAGPAIAMEEITEEKYPILSDVIDSHLETIDEFLMFPIIEDMDSIIKKLSEEEKNNIIDLYHKLNKIYKLEKFITLDDIKELTFDLVDSGFEIEYKIWCVKFTTPNGYISSLKNFPTTEFEIKFLCDEEIDKYFDMCEDIQTLIGRLSDNYQVDFKIVPFGGTFRKIISYIITVSNK